MKNRFVLFLLSFTVLATSACAQTKGALVKAYAFYFIPMPGIVPVDDQGQHLDWKRDTIFTVFIESKNSTVEWKEAYINNAVYSVQTTATASTELVVGKRLLDEADIKLKAASGTRFYQLEFVKQEGKKAPKSAFPIVLRGKYKGSTITYHIKKWTELASPAYP